MADSQDLSSKALEAIQSAQNYLNVRQGSAADAAEQASIKEWQATLDDSTAEIEVVDLSGAISDERSRKLIFDHLDLTQKQFEGLHETDPYALVDRTLRILDHHVQTLVGVHGPGGGNPVDDIYEAGPHGTGDRNPVDDICEAGTHGTGESKP